MPNEYERLAKPYIQRAHGLLTRDFDEYINAISARRDLVQKFSWSIPTDELIAAIAACSPIVSIGAGTGYIEHLASCAGATVWAYDLFPPLGGENPYKHTEQWHPVVRSTHHVAAEHADCALLLSWPPYSEAMGSRALKSYTGDTLIYIGEGRGGCTGDDELHEMIARDWSARQFIDCRSGRASTIML